MKKITAMLLTLVLLAATVLTVPAAETAFSDVPSDAWYADAVNYVRTAGIMSGTSQNAFSPEETMTRAMLVTVLHRIAGNPAAGSSADFTDVAPAAYYASAVAWAAEKGLAAGYGNGYFGAGDPVSRAQIATILWRYAGSPQAADSADFADEADIPAYAAAAVDWARANGIVNGKDGNRFDPQGNATRAQVAAILKNYLTLTADDTNPNPDADAGSRVLVAYYSASGNTERVAKAIADATGADLFEIVPETPYTSDDLNWTVSGSRVNREHEDEALRDIALTVTTPENFDKYDTVFIGYPIWWGIAAWPVDNFVKGNDFTGKTVIPFATSSSSGMGQSGSLLEGMANGGDWQSGQRFGSSASDSSVRTWAESLNLPKPTARPADASRIVSVANVPLLTLNNGVGLPQLGLGTQIQRLETDSSESGRKLLNDTSKEAVIAALKAGYRHLDTAHGYFNETGVGEGIRESGVPREEIWVTSKLWPNEYGEGVTMQAIDDMLERLQLDYLDCIYLHHPAGDYLGAWKDLEKAYREGKVRALGISNFDNWPEAFNAIMENGEIKPQILQIECHPFAQRKETRALAEQYHMQIECWYPLGHADDRLLNDAVLSEIAAAHGKSVVQIILRWHIQEGFSVIPGSTNPAHIAENIDIFDFSLTNAEMEQIRALDKGEAGRYFNLNYEQIGGFFTNPF